MKYRIMVIDDMPDHRKETYEKVFSDSDLEPIYIWSRSDFERHRNTPVDGYIIDAFLDRGDWHNTNAAELLNSFLSNPPRSAPFFLLSSLWGDEKILQVLKIAGESFAKIVQYFAWSEFQQATAEIDGAESRKESLRKKIIFELDRWHGRSSFRPGPDETVRILLLSDVQFGDPKTDPLSTLSEHWIANQLKRDKKLPDLIVVAGDISYSGDPNEFDLAAERFELDLIAPLWGKSNVENFRDRLVIVPGNHDVNLRFSACDKFKFDARDQNFKSKLEGYSFSSHQKYALEPFRKFAKKLSPQRNWEEIPDMSWVDRRFRQCGFQFFLLNSVTALTADKPSHASFDEGSMRRITRSLAEEDSSNLFNIAISHHGLRSRGSNTNQQEIENWPTVGNEFFSLHGVSMWIFGHYHQFEASTIQYPNRTGISPLWCVQLPTSRISSNRGFCLLELRRSNGSVDDAYVYSYPLLPGGVGDVKEVRVFEKG